MPEEEIEILDYQEPSGSYSQQLPNNKNNKRLVTSNNKRNPVKRTLKGTAGNVLQKTGKGVKTLGKGVKTTGQGVQAISKGAKVAGKGAKIAGKGIKATGKGIKAGTNAIGTALSAIPVVGGALGAGVKLAGTATNAAAQVGGKASELGGEALDKAGDIADKVAGKLKDAGGKLEEKGKSVQQKGERLASNEKPKSVKEQTKKFASILKLIVSIFTFIVFNFPLFFLILILIGDGISNAEDDSYNWFADYETGEFYSPNAAGNIEKAIINELDMPIRLRDGVEVSFSGESMYGISNGVMHNGIDLTEETIGALPGDTVYTIYAGEVVDVGRDNSNFEPGYWIKIRHEVSFGDGKKAIIYSYYKGLNEESVFLAKGDKVFDEQELGTLDSSGKLHFEIRKENGDSMNPINIYVPFANAVIVTNAVTGNDVVDKIISMITTSTLMDDQVKDNVHISAILGNIKKESDFSVDSVQAKIPKEQVTANTSGAIGLLQWDDRKENLINYAKSEGSTWYDIDIQLRYFEAELTPIKNREALSDNLKKYVPNFQFSGNYEKWLNLTSPEEAAIQFTKAFERCEPEFCHYTERQTNARCWYNLLQNGQGSVDYCMTHDS